MEVVLFFVVLILSGFLWHHFSWSYFTRKKHGCCFALATLWFGGLIALVLFAIVEGALHAHP